jgi:putative Ca2+/H+ antiporter (TMEM165/GDT1 family)
MGITGSRGRAGSLAARARARHGRVSRWQVFAAASAARIVSTAIGVLAWQAITAFVGERVLHWLAGLAFVAIGVMTLLRA